MTAPNHPPGEPMPDENDTQNEQPAAKVAQAMDIVKRNMLWSACAGFLPIPWIELVAIAGVEIKLIKELADHYGTPFRQDLAKAGIASLIGSLGSVTLGKAIAGSTLRVLPVIGPIVVASSVAAIAAGVTYAIGRVFVSHFESGGTLLDFDPAKFRDFFRAEFASGVKAAAGAAPAGAEAAPASA